MFYGLEHFIEKKLLPFACSALSIFKQKKPLQSIASSSQFDGEKNQPRSNRPQQNVLIIRFWGVGETILTLPMIKALKEALPNSRITVLCTPRNADVFFGQPFIDECKKVWTPSLLLFILSNLWKYDLVIDSEPHFAVSAILAFFVGKRSIGFDFGERTKLFDINVHYDDQQHVVQTFCDLLQPLGIKTKPSELVKLNYPDSARGAIDEFFDKNNVRHNDDLIIGIHAFCGPTAPWRAWPKERFAELIDHILSTYPSSTILLTGSGWEAKGNGEIISRLRMKKSGSTCNVFSVCNLSSASLFYLISKYDLMISNDTGPMHIAAAQKVPTIGLFGPNLPLRFGPYPPERNISIYHPTFGHPVINVHRNEFRACDGACMRLITVDEVFDAVKYLLSRQPNKSSDEV